MFTGPTRGISLEGDIIDLGVEHEILKKSGAFYSYGDTRLGQGRENAKIFLYENPDMSLELVTAIRELTGLPPLAAAVHDQPDATSDGEAEADPTTSLAEARERKTGTGGS
jgi:recombination protein RecA